MKKTILTIALAMASLAVNAQEGAYLSLTGGATAKAGEKVLSHSAGAFEGSFAEGWQAQVRGGYLFNETLGIELGVGYLHGDSQPIIDMGGITAEGKSRAYGASLTGIVNLSKNVYLRGGLLTKLGGHTIFSGKINQSLPTKLLVAKGMMTVEQYKQLAQAGVNGLPLEVEFERTNTGKFPLGFVGAFGVKFPISEHFSVFAEAEYQGINVSADTSEFSKYSGKFNGQPLERQALLNAVKGTPLEYEVNMLVGDEFKYVDNPDKSTNKEAQSISSPYSSFGFTFGITYNFKAWK